MKMLRISALLNLVIGLGHLACLFFLDKAFEFYGISNDMAEITKSSPALPYLITVLITMCFFIVAAYSLSINGDIKKLPLRRIASFCISAVFIGRAIWGITMLADSFSTLEFISTSVASLLFIFFCPAMFYRNKTTK